MLEGLSLTLLESLLSKGTFCMQRLLRSSLHRTNTTILHAAMASVFVRLLRRAYLIFDDFLAKLVRLS